jgi:hypothetical protein
MTRPQLKRLVGLSVLPLCKATSGRARAQELGGKARRSASAATRDWEGRHAQGLLARSPRRFLFADAEADYGRALLADGRSDSALRRWTALRSLPCSRSDQRRGTHPASACGHGRAPGGVVVADAKTADRLGFLDCDGAARRAAHLPGPYEPLRGERARALLTHGSHPFACDLWEAWRELSRPTHARSLE